MTADQWVQVIESLREAEGFDGAVQDWQIFPPLSRGARLLQLMPPTPPPSTCAWCGGDLTHRQIDKGVRCCSTSCGQMQRFHGAKRRTA